MPLALFSLVLDRGGLLGPLAALLLTGSLAGMKRIYALPAFAALTQETWLDIFRLLVQAGVVVGLTRLGGRFAGLGTTSCS